MAIPSYVFATPFLGGQAAVAAAGAVRPQHGHRRRHADRRIWARRSGFTVSGGRTDAVAGFGDLVPQFNRALE